MSFDLISLYNDLLPWFRDWVAYQLSQLPVESWPAFLSWVEQVIWGD